MGSDKIYSFNDQQKKPIISDDDIELLCVQSSICMRMPIYEGAPAQSITWGDEEDENVVN